MNDCVSLHSNYHCTSLQWPPNNTNRRGFFKSISRRFGSTSGGKAIENLQSATKTILKEVIEEAGKREKKLKWEHEDPSKPRPQPKVPSPTWVRRIASAFNYTKKKALDERVQTDAQTGPA
jgi:hypothetical protein